MKRQFSQCSDGFGVMFLHTESQGFGVQYTSYYSALSQAIKQDRTFLFKGNQWNYGFEGCDRGYECWFKPVTTCKLELENESKSWTHSVMLGRANILRSFGTEQSTSFKHIKLAMHSDLLDPPAWVTDMGKDARWWEAQLALSLFCLREEWLQQILEVKTSLRWEEPTIGMHIRRGDRTDLLKYSVDDYFQEAMKIKKQFGARHVYLASDDEKVLKKAQTDWGQEFRISSLSNSLAPSYQWNKKTPQQYSLNVFTDLYLLSECNYFVGAQRSMFGWVASRLIYAKGNERECPRWIGNDTSNPYGYWTGRNATPGECV